MQPHVGEHDYLIGRNVIIYVLKEWDDPDHPYWEWEGQITHATSQVITISPTGKRAWEFPDDITLPFHKIHRIKDYKDAH